MKNKNAYARYRLIDQRLNNTAIHAPKLQDLVEYVSEKLDMSVSVSSIQKDIYAMRYDSNLGFNAPIAYDRYSRAYTYTEDNYSISNIPVSAEDLKGLEFAISILEQFKDIPAIKIFDDAIAKIAASVKQNVQNDAAQNQVFVLDRPNYFQGVEHMPLIVDAIKGRNEMILKYQAFGKEERKHKIHPYFIREYKGRLYLIAKAIHATKEAKTLTFSFDRMNDVIKMHETYAEESVSNKAYFDATIGISLTDKGAEKIELKFMPAQANYLKSQPLHHSQKILADDAKEFRISLDVVINYEFTEKVKGYGASVQVIKPASLATLIKDEAQQVLKLYK
jgi:predicted DNA-binding transcriptional regulator YafY